MKKINNKADFRYDEKAGAQKAVKVVRNTSTYLFLGIMAIIVLIPFYWMFNVSFQSAKEVMDSTSLSFYPKEFSPHNYREVLFFTSESTGADNNFGRFLYNTLFVAFFSTLGGTLFSILVAFALARLNFKGREFIFSLLLATMMIPGEMLVITNFLTVSKLGWFQADGIGSYLAMIIPFMISIFHIYLLRQNFKQIPDELYYSAKIDGCSDFKYLWRIMVPMAKSSIITITILKIMGAWNAYVWPNIVAHRNYMMITSWLRSGFKDSSIGEARTLINLQMAASVVVTVPLLIFFVVFRKYIMSGVSRSGLKG